MRITGQAMWGNLWWFANTSFGAALVAGGLASLAGALGGALAAQSITDKARRRKQLLDEIRGCNAGIDAVGSILNEFLNLKGQHLVALKHEYDEQRGAIEVQRIGRDEGWVDRGLRLDLRVDQGSLPVMRLPVARLERVMTEQVTVSGRPQRADE
jgi:hypothetical protein